MTTLLVLIAAVVPFSVTPFIASQIATGPAPAMPPWLVPLLPVLGLWLLSAGVGGLNAVIRARDTAKEPVSPALRLVASVLNAIVANLDKTKEQAAIASGAAEPRPAPEVKP